MGPDLALVAPGLALVELGLVLMVDHHLGLATMVDQFYSLGMVVVRSQLVVAQCGSLGMVVASSRLVVDQYGSLGMVVGPQSSNRERRALVGLSKKDKIWMKWASKSPSGVCRRGEERCVWIGVGSVGMCVGGAGIGDG